MGLRISATEWRWVSSQPATQTCADCGITRNTAYVQPQYRHFQRTGETIALCAPCLTERTRRTGNAPRGYFANP